MVDEQAFFWDLSLGMLFIAGVADILFIWVLHFTSTRYPRPNDDGSWNQSAFSIKYPHDCCKDSCNEDLSRCCCGIRCRKISCPAQCNCFYPLELFIPRYPSSFFSYLEPDSTINGNEYLNDENIKDLELKSLKDNDETKQQTEFEEEEEKDDEMPSIKRRYSSVDSIEQNSNLRIFSERYGKCCCCSCFSILFKIWFLICGILSFTIFIIFTFTMFFELWIKCATWKNAEFLGFLVIIFVICKIFIWFLYHSFQACWLLVYNTCDANNILIVEWWRFYKIFWCVMFAIIYLTTVDPDALTNALVGQSIARFMLIQGIVWIIIYWIAVIFGSIWLIINLFECNKKK
eukprot:120080_1